MYFISIIFNIILFTFSMNISHAETIQSSMDRAVNKLNDLYYIEPISCINNLKREGSAVSCSGVFIHGIEPDQTHAWIPSQGEKRHSVSFSYLRNDLPTTELYEGSGFIYDQTIQSNNTKNLRYYCFYPFDAFSSMENSHPAKTHGCGLPATQYTNSNTFDFASCPEVSITTASQWIKTYLNNGQPSPFVPEACSFSANHVNSFLQALDVQKTTNSPFWNEIITESWTENEAAALPIIGFFYLVGDEKAKLTAQAHQRDYCEMYKKFLPVVTLDFSQRTHGAFSSRIEDQIDCK